MQISSRFTIAVHIFACIKTFENDYKITSDFLAGGFILWHIISDVDHKHTI